MNRKNPRKETDFSYDPVSALKEKEASGTTGKIFSDIRETMNIPILTSIWRGLAGVRNSLSPTWKNIKPMYVDNQPWATIDNIIQDLKLPSLRLATTQLRCLGLKPRDIENIKLTVKAYNRSNGLNFVTMTALVNHSGISNNILLTSPSIQKSWPCLPSLLEKEEIPDYLWHLIKCLNALGTNTGIHSHVATLWRHLAIWPQFLALLYSALSPLNNEGNLHSLSKSLIELAKNQAHGIRKNGCNFHNIPENAQKIIFSYVNSPSQVARMVVIGNIIERLLEQQEDKIYTI